jgi:hypothetical protein
MSCDSEQAKGHNPWNVQASKMGIYVMRTTCEDGRRIELAGYRCISSEEKPSSFTIRNFVNEETFMS